MNGSWDFLLSFSISSSSSLSHPSSHLSLFGVFALFYSLYLPVSHMHTLIHFVMHADCHISPSDPTHLYAPFPPCLPPSLICYHCLSFLHSPQIYPSLRLSLAHFLRSVLTAFFLFSLSIFSSVIMSERCRGPPGPLSLSHYPLPLSLLLLSHSSLFVFLYFFKARVYGRLIIQMAFMEPVPMATTLLHRTERQNG